MLPKFLRCLCCVSPSAARTKLLLDLLPDEIIFEILCKMRYGLIIKMLKTCSRMNCIGENYRETIFAKEELGFQLNFSVYEHDDIIVSLAKPLKPEYIQNLVGLSVSKIRVSFFAHIADIEAVRKYFKDLQLKCGKLKIFYGEWTDYFPVSDAFSWKKAAITKSFSNEALDEYILFLDNLKKENGSDLFEVDVHGPHSQCGTLPKDVLWHS